MSTGKVVQANKTADVGKGNRSITETAVKIADNKKNSKNYPRGDYSEFSYVVKETKHTLMIIGGIVVAYLVLWYLFTHTGIGPAIYRSIKL